MNKEQSKKVGLKYESDKVKKSTSTLFPNRTWMHSNRELSITVFCGVRQQLIPFMSEATHPMIVNHPGSLHESVSNRRPEKPKTPTPQIIAQGDSFLSSRRNIPSDGQ